MNKEELLVNIEVAELLNKIGYTEGSEYYSDKANITSIGNVYVNGTETNIIEVPTLEEANKWLRDNYKMCISVHPTTIKGDVIRFNFRASKYKHNSMELLHLGGNDYTYEDAFNYGLKIVLTEILKK